MTAKELREKRAKLAARIRELADAVNKENREFTEEEKTNWEQVNKDYNDLTRSIERAERAEKVEAEQRTPVGDSEAGHEDLDGRRDPHAGEERSERTRQAAGGGAGTRARQAAGREEDRALAIQAWFRHQSGEELSERQQEACRRVGLNPARRNLDLALPDTRSIRRMTGICRSTHPSLVEQRFNELSRERRDLSAYDGPAGAFTVPEGFVNQLELNMLAFGGMLQVADILRTNTGADLPWPTADDTSNTGEQIGEGGSIGDSVDPTFSQVILKAYMYSSKLIKVPATLLEDSAFDMAAVTGAMLGERLGRISNTKFTTGTGAATPKGVITAATSGVTAASATAIAADEILDLIHSVDPAYRVGARFMMHDSVLLAIRKLKDGEGQYLWQSGIQMGAPDALHGYPLAINQDMASTIEASAKTLLFGQLSKYKVRQVRGIRMRRLVERYADTDHEGFVAFIRQDGNLLDAGSHPVKYLEQAAS